MAKKFITGVLVSCDLANGIARFDLEQSKDSYKNLQRIYDMLKCDCIDVVSRKFGQHYYDIYCDDEGTFKPIEEQVVSVFTLSHGTCVEQIVGNVFICKHDGEGGMESLTDDEIQEVCSLVVSYIHPHLEREIHALGASL